MSVTVLTNNTHYKQAKQSKEKASQRATVVQINRKNKEIHQKKTTRQQ